MVWKRKLLALGACCLCTSVAWAQVKPSGPSAKSEREQNQKATKASQPRAGGKVSDQEARAQANAAQEQARKQSVAAQELAALQARKAAAAAIVSDPGEGPGPANNACGSPSVIGDGATAFNTTGATTDGVQSGCPQANNDVWYTYTASCSGTLTVTTCGSGFDTVLYAYSDCTTCPPTGQLACNDDSCGLQSSISFGVTSGTCYKLRLGSFGSATTGTGTINITCAGGGGGNDNCADRIDITDGATPFDTAGATTDGTPNGPACVFFGDDLIFNDLWYNYTATCTGTVTVNTCGSAGDTELAAYDGCDTANCPPSNPIACNDDSCGLLSQVTFAATAGNCYKIRLGTFSAAASASGNLNVSCAGGGGCPMPSNCCVANGGLGCDCPECQAIVCAADAFCCDTAWDGICANEAAAMCGDLCGGGPGVCGPGNGDCCVANGTPGCDDEACCNTVCAADPFCCDVSWDGICANEAVAMCPGLCMFTCPPNEGSCCVSHAGPGCNDPDCCATVCAADPFCCQVSWDGICAGEAQAMCPVACPPPPPPANDNCVDRIDIGDGATPYDTAGATTDGIPGGCPDANNDIWFNYTASCDGIAIVNTCGSSGDSVLYAYNGCDTANCPPVGEITCNDDSCGLGSQISFSVTAGNCYKIRLGNFSPTSFGTAGNLNVTCLPPLENDACADRIPICEGATAFNTAGATTDGLQGTCPQAFNDIWYNYTASCNGVAIVDTCGSMGDTVLYAYNGCDTANCPPSGEIACNDDSCGLQSLISFQVTAGNCYKIRLGNFGSGGASSGNINIACTSCDTSCPPGGLDEAAFDPNCGLAPAGGSNCCFAHPGVGCDDPDCQAIVCAVDSFCCNVAWDGICAGEAAAMCGDLCASAADPDGGCNVTPNAFFSPDLVCGSAVCGSYAAANGTRDTDWFTVTVTENTQLTWTVTGLATTASAVLDANCPPTILNFVTGNPCQAVTSTACVGPGTYHLFAAPNTFAGVACPTPYLATLSCAPCAGPGSNCCFAHAGVGCDDPDCQAIVCAADSFCCNVSWDGICASEAMAMCGTLCGGGGGAPANDNCADRIDVGNGPTPFNTAGATTDGTPNGAACVFFGDDLINNDIWYNYTALGNGSVTVSLCGSTGDTELAAYDGCDTANCPPSNPIACNDDTCGLLSQIMFNVVQGNCYKIRLGTFSAGASASGTMNIMGPTGPPPGIAASNPPSGIIDPLQTGPAPGPTTVTQGIGAAGTPNEGPVVYSPIAVTFSGPVSPTPNACNVTVCCTDAAPGGDCPTVTSVSTSGNTTTIGLSGPIPTLECTTIEFADGQKVQYRYHPGNVGGGPGGAQDAFANTQDLLALVTALNNGSANMPANHHRYDVNRSSSGATPVNTQDLLRLVQLLNGVSTDRVYNGTTVAACPAACP